MKLSKCKIPTFLSKFNKYILYLSAFFWSIICFTTVFDIYESNNGEIKLSGLLIIACSILFISVIVLVYKFIEKLNKRKCDSLILILSILFFAVLLLWSLNYQALPTYDLTHINDIVKNMFNNNSHIIGSNSYISQYPHQIPLIVLFYLVHFVSNIINVPFENMLIIYNCLMISLSSYLIYKIVDKYIGYRIAFIAFLLFILIPDFYLYASYCYTDIISMPYMLLGLYFLVHLDDNKLKNKIYIFLSALFFFISIKLRVVNCFILIAFILYLLLNKKILLHIKKIALFLLIIISLNLIYSKSVYSFFDIKIDKNLKLPATHWIMMGSNVDNDGSYLKDDVFNTISEKNKIKYNFKIIKERFKKADSRFYYNKLRRVWSVGDYGILTHYRNMNKYDYSYNFLNGPGSIIVRYIQQILKFIIYFFFLITIIKQLFVKDDKESYSQIYIFSIFGAIIFYLIWEAQIRYSFSFFPLILIGGIISVKDLEKIFDLNILVINNKKIGFYNIKKGLFIFSCIVFFLSLIIFYKNFCYNKSKRQIIKENQPAGSPVTAIKIVDKKFKQTFSASGNFNTISLLFYSDNLKENLKYVFELYNDSDELLYKKEFNAKDAINVKYKKFYPNIKSKGKHKYYFLIYSNSATEENNVSLLAYNVDSCSHLYSSKGYDINPDASSFYDDKVICNELRYSVYEEKKKSIFSKKFYLIFCVALLSVLVLPIALYYKKNSKENRFYEKYF